MIEQMAIFYHETQGDSMDEKQGPICAGVGNLCDQCLRNQEQPQYNSGYNIGNNRRK